MIPFSNCLYILKKLPGMPLQIYIKRPQTAQLTEFWIMLKNNCCNVSCTKLVSAQECFFFFKWQTWKQNKHFSIFLLKCAKVNQKYVNLAKSRLVSKQKSHTIFQIQPPQWTFFFKPKKTINVVQFSLGSYSFALCIPIGILHLPHYSHQHRKVLHSPSSDGLLAPFVLWP